MLLIFSILKEKKKSTAYVPKIILNCGKKKILLMIPNEEKQSWHYLSVKKLSALLRETTSKHDGDFFTWIVFILLE